MSETTRRKVLAGAAGISAAAALSACANDPETRSDSDAGAPPVEAPSATPTSAVVGGALAVKTDIPVGSGKIFKDQGVVVTQPAAGEFKAFSSTCTHQGCTVSGISAGTITCSCHNSTFSTADGSVQGGPAKAPLASKTIKIEGDSILLA